MLRLVVVVEGGLVKTGVLALMALMPQIQWLRGISSGFSGTVFERGERRDEEDGEWGR